MNKKAISSESVLYFILIIFAVLLFFDISINDINNFTEEIVINQNNSSNSIVGINTEVVADTIKDSFSDQIYNKSKIKELFYEEVNNIRINSGKSEISISPRLEEKASFCASKFNQECLTENFQDGVGWQMPWHISVCEESVETSEGYFICAPNSRISNCQGNSRNIDCLIDSLKNDYDINTRIYDDILLRDRIGIGIVFDQRNEEVSYWIILE